jgi:hypothetical protein
MWTLGGRYLQTLGTFKPWKHVPSDPEVQSEMFEFTTPPDIMRLGSSTTLRVNTYAVNLPFLLCFFK